MYIWQAHIVSSIFKEFMQLPGALPMLVWATLRCLRRRSGSTRAQYSVPCSSPPCLRSCHASSTLEYFLRGQLILSSLLTQWRNLFVYIQANNFSVMSERGFHKLSNGWFIALCPKSTAMVMAGRPVHLTTLFPGQA